MILSRILIATLAASGQPVFAGDLETLDRAGRRVAEKPCPRPKISAKTEKNIHDESVMDRYITQLCPGAGSEIVQLSKAQYKHVFPLVASLSKADSRMPPAFQVGVLLSSIKSRLGTPEVEKVYSVTYLLPSESREERVTFLHDGEHVVRIEWAWYFD